MGVNKLKTLRIKILALSLISFAVNAEDLSIPHSFTSGTSIKSSEMNENFSSISNAVNQQNAAMTTTSSEINETLSSISIAVNQQTEVMTTIVEGVSAIETGVSGVSQSTDSNGLTLSDISLMLNNVSESLASIDTKLSTESSVADQLVCTVSPASMSSFIKGSTIATCLQVSSGVRVELGLGAITRDDWIAVSISSDEMIFHK